MSDLRESVARAMSVVGCGWRETSPGVFAATIPPSLRHHFRGQPTLRVVFDPEVWQQDRRSELAAPGGGFLDGLERALADHAGQAIRVSGVLESDGAKGQAWAAQVRVTNAEVEKLDHPISYEQALRFVFEAEIPVSPPVTEIIAVACDLRGSLLTPEDLARRDPPEAYDYDEVAGAVQSGIDWPAAHVERLRQRCLGEAERRIKRVFASELRRRRDRGAEQVEEARAALQRELAEAQSAGEREELEQEFARRRSVYQASAAGTIRVQERTVTLLVTGKDSLVPRYRHRSGTVVDIVPKMSLGRLRDDQCAHCQQARTEYVVAAQAAELWCTHCARACAASDCASTMLVSATTCPRCTEVRWCERHVSKCATCAAPRCPDHGGSCVVCGEAACEAHIRKHTGSNESLCATHGRTCAVDGATLRDSELTPCARSGDAVCAQHRASVELPAGAVVRSDRLRVCTASGITMDVDFAGVCTVDGQVYVATSLVECPVTGLRLHPRNAVAAHLDERVLHPDAVRQSTVSTLLVARDRALSDDFLADQVLHPTEATRCELSKRWTAKARTVKVGCCGRVVAQPLTATHSATGLPLCQEHAASCATDRAVFHTDDLRTCSASGVRVCAAHGALIDDPAGEFVRRERIRVCAETGHRIDEGAAGICSVDGATYKRKLLATCPIKGLIFHPKNGVRPDGDTRLLHPNAVVKCDVSGKAVAVDVAIPDAFAKRVPLHPDAAVRCELSSKWTALVRTVMTACCAKRVALSLTETSLLSGRRVCQACAQACAAGHGPFLPNETRTCAVSGTRWCLHHLVATGCGRHVGPDRAIHLDDGTWECVEHYRPCSPGGHPANAGELARSIISGRECCPTHRAHCQCHGGVVGLGEPEADPYDGSAWCPESMGECARCGERAPRAHEPSLCRWCAAPVALEQADGDLVQAYHRRVKPRLAWYTVRLSVRVTGTARLAWFSVGTLTGGQLVFRVTPDTVEERAPGGVRRAP